MKSCKFLSGLALSVLMSLNIGCKFGHDSDDEVDAKKIAEKFSQLKEDSFKNLKDQEVTEYSSTKVMDEIVKLDSEHKQFAMLINNITAHSGRMIKAYLESKGLEASKNLINGQNFSGKNALEHICSMKTSKAEDTTYKAWMLGAMLNFGADANQFTKEGSFDPMLLTQGMAMVNKNVQIYGMLSDGNKKAWTKHLIEDCNKSTPALAFKEVYTNCSAGDKKSLHTKLMLVMYDKNSFTFLSDNELQKYGLTNEIFDSARFDIGRGQEGSLFYVLMSAEQNREGGAGRVGELGRIFKERLGGKYENHIQVNGIMELFEDEPFPSIYQKLDCPGLVEAKHVEQCVLGINKIAIDERTPKEMELLQWLFASVMSNGRNIKGIGNIDEELLPILARAIIDFGTKAEMDALFNNLTADNIGNIAIEFRDDKFSYDGDTTMPTYFQSYYNRQDNDIKLKLRDSLFDWGFKRSQSEDMFEEIMVKIINSYLPGSDLKGDNFDIDNDGDNTTLLHNLIILLGTSYEKKIGEARVRSLSQSLKQHFTEGDWRNYVETKGSEGKNVLEDLVIPAAGDEATAKLWLLCN